MSRERCEVAAGWLAGWQAGWLALSGLVEDRFISRNNNQPPSKQFNSISDHIQRITLPPPPPRTQALPHRQPHCCAPALALLRLVPFLCHPHSRRSSHQVERRWTRKLFARWTRLRGHHHPSIFCCSSRIFHLASLPDPLAAFSPRSLRTAYLLTNSYSLHTIPTTTPSSSARRRH